MPDGLASPPLTGPIEDGRIRLAHQRDRQDWVCDQCVVANLVRRPDGSHVAFDGNLLFDWAKASGTIYQAELQRLLTLELGVAWAPDRNGTREMVGLGHDVLRAFSKRSVMIEAELEASGARYESPAARMRADDAASLATRPAKDRSLTPSLLVERWRDEAAELGIDSAVTLEAALVGRSSPRPLDPAEVTAALVDPETGLCATEARFTEAHVYEHVAAQSAGRWTTAEITTMASDFLASEHVVRLSAGDRRRPPEWSTVAHRALEDAVLEHLSVLAARPSPAIDPERVEDAIAAEERLGADQAAAVRALCGAGADLRSMIAPAGFGKTTAVHAAAAACTAAGRPVLGVATTNQAVAGLRAVGLSASTIARLRFDLTQRPLAPGTVVVLDEVSQVSTRDAATVLEAVAATPGASLWCLGDPRQAPAVGAGGLGAEVTRLGAEGAIVAPRLVTNHRQRDAADRDALGELRAGRAASSQAIRSEHGWEHEEATPFATREAMAEAVVADVAAHGAEAVAVLAVSHADCEDLADRIRARLAAGGHLGGPSLSGPAWGAGPDRSYAVGDRVLLTPSPATPACTTARPARWWPSTTRACGWPSTAPGRSPCRRRSWLAAGATGTPTSPMRGPARSTARRAGRGRRCTCWARPTSTPWWAIPTRAGAGRRPTPGTPRRWRWPTTAVWSPTSAAPPRRCWPVCAASPSPPSPPPTTRGFSTPACGPSATATWPCSTPPRPIAPASCAAPRTTPGRRRGRPGWPPTSWPGPRSACGPAGPCPACAVRGAGSAPMPRPPYRSPATPPSGQEPAARRRGGG